MKTIMKGASILTAILMFSMVLTPVLGGVVLPHERWGTAYDGAPINGGLITSWIDGVEYGRDITSGIGEFSIDTWGDSTDTPTLRTGGYEGAGDEIQYVNGDLMSASGPTAMFFAETDTWTVGGATNVDLTAGTTIDLLKINNISYNSGLLISSYVVLHNPGAGTVDVSANYALEVADNGVPINVGGNIAAGLGDWDDAVIPAGGFVVIDMAAWGGSFDSATSIMLTYNGWVIDRVEYGTIGSEPQDTTMSNAQDLAADEEIHRTAVGVDTNACAADFAAPSSPYLPIAADPTATATGPASAWTNVAGVTITYSVTDAPASVNLYYSTNGGTNWNFIAADSPADGSYGWTCPADGEYDWYASCNNPTDPNPSGGEGPEAGTYQYDGTAPTVDAGPALGVISVPTAQNAVVDASLSGVDTYAWIQTIGPGSTTFAPSAAVEDPTVNGDLDGDYTCQLTVTDNAGNSASDTFTYTWLNLLATATATGPTATWTNVAGVTITYSTANSPSTVGLYYSTDGGTNWNFIANDPSIDGTYDWTCPADGQYSWIAVGDDEAAPIGGDPPEDGTYDYDGTAPIVDAGPALGVISAPTAQNAVVDASISGVFSYAWIQTIGPGSTTFAPSAAVEDPTVNGDTDGDYTCQLTVTDNAGNSASDTFTYTWLGGSGTTPDYVWANKSAGQVRLEWSGGAQPYEIYISSAVDGTGFNFAGAPDVATINANFYTFNVLGDGNSYSYIVLGEGDAATPHPNLVFKFAKQVSNPVAPNINWVSLPYDYQWTTLQQVAEDIAPGGVLTWEVRVWSTADNQYYGVVFDDLFLTWGGAGAGYVITPGDAVLIFARSTGDWDIVGGHNPTYGVSITNPVAPNINWVGLPMNHNFGTLQQVAEDIAPGGVLTWEVRVWSTADNQYYGVVFDDLFLTWGGAGAGYVMSPGDAVLVFARASGPWTPSATNP